LHALQRPPPRSEFSFEQLGQLCLRAQLASLLARPGLAANLGDALALAERRGVMFCGGWPLFVPRLRAAVAAQEGHGPRAEQGYRRALELAEACGARLELAHTLLDLAEWLVQSESSHDEARELLRRAGALCQELRLVTLGERCSVLTERLGS
jgi:hypothetical protein